MHVRTSSVAALVAAAAAPRGVASAGCSPAYSAGASYGAGDVVSATTSEPCHPHGTASCPHGGSVSVTYNYACQAGPTSAYCGQSGFAPDGIYSGSAWDREATPCTGTASPPTPGSPPAPVPAPPPVPAPWSGGGCPVAFVAGTAYDAGDVVSVAGASFTTVYQCAVAPTNQFCGMNGYEPGTGLHPDAAWTALGSCTGTVAPTTSPNFVSLADAGGCPAAFDDGATYESGDRVSLNRLVYQCREGATGLNCPQAGFEPGSLAGPKAWRLEGFCDGTVAPTTSPVFVSLADAGGCPGAFDGYADYESGDRVSLNGLVYECVEGDNGLYCPQAGFKPGSPNGDVAWHLKGFCDGTIAPSTSPVFVSLTDVGGCPGPFDASADYEEGDAVVVDGLVYKCKPASRDRHCSQAGFQPGVAVNGGGEDVEHWRKGWKITGFCSGTVAPTGSPSFDVLVDVGGCPGVWESGVFNYEEGDRVSDGTLVYECKASPESRHCGQAGYEPNTNPATPDAWMDAWTVVGHCAGSGAPTSSPVFDSAGSVGVCPNAWERGSNVAYEEGDMVSVTVSQYPLRQLAYRCKAWPFSGFCGQFSPGEFGGDQGWKFSGSCEGSIGPTASPSFDALATTGDGCPAAYSSARVDYEAGDLVAYSVSDSPARKIVFQCREWPNNGYCNQGVGFEPTTRYANLAWTLVGTCDGSMAPTSSPVAYAGTCVFEKCVTTQVSCVAGSHGCVCGTGHSETPACTKADTTCSEEDVLPWSSTATYVQDDVVRVGVKQFKCRTFPNNLWCSQAAYMPALEDNNVWSQAWIAMTEDCM